MPEYTKMKNADLEALLKSRGLPTGGKKADMVERLTKDDEKKASGATPSTAKPAAANDEDEIDWDDDVEEAPTAKPTPATAPIEAKADAAAVVEKAGGEGVVGNPQAVPNQVAAIDPSKTNDLTVDEAAENKDKAKAEEKKEPPPDYSRGLAATNLDAEIEKRKARAKKFGLNIDDDEGLKKLERAKKFGEVGPPKGLDEALPERSARKRGRDTNDEGARGGDKRRGGRFGGRHGRGGRDDRRNDREEDRGRPSNKSTNWMSETDRSKAEARKAKWAAPAASSRG